jgi:hypothetical protein
MSARPAPPRIWLSELTVGASASSLRFRFGDNEGVVADRLCHQSDRDGTGVVAGNTQQEDRRSSCEFQSHGSITQVVGRVRPTRGKPARWPPWCFLRSSARTPASASASQQEQDRLPRSPVFDPASPCFVLPMIGARDPYGRSGTGNHDGVRGSTPPTSRRTMTSAATCLSVRPPGGR